MSLRSQLYALARMLGWVNAFQRGPSAVGKRIVRRALYKQAGKTINKITR